MRYFWKLTFCLWSPCSFHLSVITHHFFSYGFIVTLIIALIGITYGMLLNQIWVFSKSDCVVVRAFNPCCRYESYFICSSISLTTYPSMTNPNPQTQKMFATTIFAEVNTIYTMISWARRVWGRWGGCFCIVLYAFCCPDRAFSHILYFLLQTMQSSNLVHFFDVHDLEYTGLLTRYLQFGKVLECLGLFT